MNYTILTKSMGLFLLGLATFVSVVIILHFAFTQWPAVVISILTIILGGGVLYLIIFAIYVWLEGRGGKVWKS
jgi:hypothetical protein